jgi:MutS domain V
VRDGPPETSGLGYGPGPSPAETYAELRADRLADERRLAGVSLRFSVARGFAFAAILGALLLAVFAGGRPLPWRPLATAGAAVTVFAALAAAHARCLRRLRLAEELRRIVDEGLARLDRDWDRLPLVSEPPRDRGLPLARDLDLYGRASLFQLLGTAHTPAAKALLRAWLEGAAPPAEVRARQAAVAELAELLDFRQGLELAVRGMEPGAPGRRAGGPANALLAAAAGAASFARTPGNPAVDPPAAPRRGEGGQAPRGEGGQADCEPFLRWAEEKPWLLARPALLWAARVAAVLTLAAAAAGPRWGLSPLLVMAILNLGLTNAYRREVGSRLERVSASRDEIMRYAAALRHAVSHPFTCARLRALAAALAAPPVEPASEGHVLAGGSPPSAAAPAHQETTPTVVSTPTASAAPAPPSSAPPSAAPPAPASAPSSATRAKRPRSARSSADWLALLESRLGLADARHSGSLHFVLQVLLLWDFHTLALLEGWQRDAGRHARRWLTTLGELEALAALAALRFENPGWCLPEVAAGEPELRARDLGHPLLPPARRVGNDVTVGPAGTFLLVTGSNMSGKSTLLRAIGVNVALAQAGGPACAAAMRLPPLRLATSILVEDSLAGGISFFLAELLRIKQVVAAAAEAGREGAALLYLLDEVLRGTNSVERRIAVRRVLRHLLAQGALGAVSTHDLELAAGAGLAPAARQVHFRETLTPGAPGSGAPRMTFDYRLRPGPATTTNALELLRQVGLDLPPDAEGREK